MKTPGHYGRLSFMAKSSEAENHAMCHSIEVNCCQSGTKTGKPAYSQARQRSYWTSNVLTLHFTYFQHYFGTQNSSCTLAQYTDETQLYTELKNNNTDSALQNCYLSPFT